MEDDTGHHEVVAHFLHFLIVCSGGDSPAGALKDQGEEITKDEDPSVPSCSQTGIFLTDSEDDVLEGKVDASGNESLWINVGQVHDNQEYWKTYRSNDEAANLHIETGL